MDAIRSVTSLPAPDRARPERPLQPADAGGGSVETRGLDPAVSLSLSSDPGGAQRGGETLRRGFERDPETSAVVFRISDAASGDVVLQIPDEVVIKARAYGAQPSAPVGERVAKTA